MADKREYLKVPEVAEVFRIARTRTYELVAEGEMMPKPGVRVMSTETAML